MTLRHRDAVIDWLLQGPPWLEYAVRKQLLDEDADVVVATQDSAVLRLVARVKDPRSGLPAYRSGNVSCEVEGSAVWDLYILADIGFQAVHLGLERVVEIVLGGQQGDDCFITEPGMAPNYFCLSGVLISAIARLGYADAPPLARFLRRLLTAQRTEGGWNCEDYERDACPMDNLNVLMLLGEYSAYRRDARFNGALNLLLRHWREQDRGTRLSGFGIGRRYRSLQYPATKYGILRVLDVLCRFPHAVSQPAFGEMLDFVRRQAVEGRYDAALPPGSYHDFDFGQTAEPSRWITFLVRRIEKRALEAPL